MLDFLRFLLTAPEIDGLTAIALILLFLVGMRMYARARTSANQYRTANGLTIERDCRRIVSQPHAMPVRKLRAGAKAPPAEPSAVIAVKACRLNANQLARVVDLHTSRLEGIRGRATAAAVHDWANGRKRRPGPFTLGTVENLKWHEVYDPAFAAREAAALSVQTSARLAAEPVEA